jgi:hypothetical protein
VERDPKPYGLTGGWHGIEGGAGCLRRSSEGQRESGQRPGGQRHRLEERREVMNGHEQVDMICPHFGQRPLTESTSGRCPTCGGELVAPSGLGPGSNYAPKPQGPPYYRAAQWIATDWAMTSVGWSRCLACGRECLAIFVRHQEGRVTCPPCGGVDSMSVVPLMRMSDRACACGAAELDTAEMRKQPRR